MRILIVQLVPPETWDGRNDYADDVARLGARLRQQGHEPSLLLLSCYDEDVLRLKIADVRPEHVVIYLESFYVNLARRLTEHVANRYYLPLIIGGPHATVSPHEMLSLIGVEGVVLGEWDRAVPQYLEARQFGSDYLGTEGFWFKTENGIVRNPIAEPEKPEEMVPVPDRSLYSADQVVDERGYVAVQPTRGCRFYCAHCQMDLAAGLYEERQMTYLRRRSVAHLIEEAVQLRAAYPGLQGLKFQGCAFALDEAWLKEFAEAFPAAARLPFNACVKASGMNAEVARRLKQAGCQEVTLEVLSGSDFIRNEIFNLDLSEGQIARAFTAVREAGMRTRALVQVGLPYDTVVTMAQTGNLLRRVGPDAIEARVYFPFPGTKAYELCQENGWLSGRGGEEYFQGQAILDLPGLDSGAVRRYATLIPHLAHWPNVWPLLMRLERIRIGRRTLADLVAPLLGQRWGRHSK